MTPDLTKAAEAAIPPASWTVVMGAGIVSIDQGGDRRVSGSRLAMQGYRVAAVALLAVSDGWAPAADSDL